MIDLHLIDFAKGDGLVPVIAQDVDTGKVLMLGYANEEAIEKSVESGNLTFFSRSKQRLWTKGEESGHFLTLIDMTLDCDQDTILAKVKPVGPVCHMGTDTCWGESNELNNLQFLSNLEQIISARKSQFNVSNSYVAGLFAEGINKIAQKVGEEAVELIIEAKDDNESLFLGEAADLLFHYLILLQAKGHSLDDVVHVLKQRHKEKK
ncbi:MAG: bifunctional phosphoribosyl-AMP cyclohydrolase/phosphoribosyl-ATP diphosphatase HisIE [Saprospiraceae bacterium]